MTVEEIVQRLEKSRRQGSGWIARCPGHDDRDPSLSVSEGDDGRTLLKCFAGCETEAITTALGISTRDLFADSGIAPAGRPTTVPTATYAYQNADGTAHLRKHRFVGRDGGRKSFAWEFWDGSRWSSGKRGQPSGLYRLPELLAADSSLPVFVVEGEKAADRMAAAGAIATTSGGATSWTPNHAEGFPAGRDVVVLPDNDEEGERYAAKVAEALSPRAGSLRIVRLPGLPPKGDPFDYLEGGRALREILDLVAITPVYAAPQPRRLVVSIEELFAERVSDTPLILGHGVIPRQGLILLAGEGGVGKTALAVQLVLSIAAGREALGMPVPTPAPVLFWEAEGNRRLFTDRVRTAANSLGIASEGLPLFFGSNEASAGIEGPDLEQMILDSRAELVVLDTIGLFHDGEENSTSDWKTRVVKPLRGIASRTGAAFLFLHHLSKPSEARSGRHRIRGTSAMVDDSDAALMLEAAKGDSAGQGRVLRFAKIKHGPPKEAIALRFDTDRAIFEATGDDPVLLSQPRMVMVQSIVIEAGDITTADLKAAIMAKCNVGRASAENDIDSAQRNGVIQRVGRGRYGPPADFTLLQFSDSRNAFRTDQTQDLNPS